MFKKAENIPQNLQSGLIVSLVALPLGFGLALASGVPPMAGIIATVAGAVFFWFFGSSRLIIAGPGNGLVVLSLYGVSVLGAGDNFLGYQLLLGAICVSGVFIFLMGLFRFGVLSEVFPAAAIRGMLAAIGLLILSRQLHVLLGAVPENSSAFGLVAELPHTIGLILNKSVPTAAYLLGISSLILLFVLPKLKWWIFQKIPGPMWVLGLGIGYAYLAPNHLGSWPQLPANQLIVLPPVLSDAITFPSFEAWTQGSFWSISFSLAFVAAIESLLSIKAIDKLDPQQRRSNANKDLKALGLATIGSSLIGGLNVVAVIARSSVNLNNGATNSYSNLFHGLFLVVFLALFGSQLEHIPLAVLAAILVHTGYKLTAPSQFRAMLEIGKDELILFILTYLITLATNLILGILSGMIITLIYQLIILGRRSYYFQQLLRPNVLLFEEQRDKYHLSVKSLSNFLNYVRLKKQLDTIDPHNELILDFSMADFVDHSVLEHIHQYRQRFEIAGGHLEIIGLDDLGQSSAHPLATRKPRTQGKHEGKLTRRQKMLRLYATEFRFNFYPREIEDHGEFFGFDYFRNKLVHLLRNRLQNSPENWLWADVHFEDYDFYGNALRHASMLVIPLNKTTAPFVLDKESLLDRVAYLAGFKDINFDLHPDFSQRFKLKGENEKDIRKFFQGPLISFLENHKQYHIECNGKALLIFDKDRVATISETKQMVNFAEQLTEVLKNECT
jgi:carbonic anhydrase